ncbi:hypothetical protein PAEPH01_1488 [Pancytospora epiphaga]|nr:hypothetical protein PAEPH01_1488 [Pancytospora epiphaga]
MTVETKKKRKYDVLANKLGSEIEVRDKNNFVCNDIGWCGNKLSQPILERDWDNRLCRGVHPNNQWLYRKRSKAFLSNISVDLFNMEALRRLK